jgi:hypothetical protein
MSDTKFKRVTEDFTCENCGFGIKGNGFTNHCPKCLYSKHVDIFPGDRSEGCGGLMEPIGAEKSGGEWSLIHRYLKCKKTQKNRISEEDDFEEIIRISSKN